MKCRVYYQTMINLKELFNDPDELHAYLIGISHGFFVWQKHECPEKYKTEHDELHYYEQGKILGMIFLGLFQVFIGYLIVNLWF